MEYLEADFEQSQSDLRLAFKRIADLQAVMEDDIDSDMDSEFDRSVKSLEQKCVSQVDVDF